MKGDLGEWTLPKHAPLLRVLGRVGMKQAVILLDTGCKETVVGKRYAGKLGKDEVFRNKVGYSNVVRQANGMVLDCGYTVDSELQVSTGQRRRLHADVLEVGNRDVILGMEWLRENKV